MKKTLALFVAITTLLSNTVFALVGVTATPLTKFNKSSIPENIFKVAGNSQSFTLIGETDEKYFIASNEDYGVKSFSETGNQIFNPNEKDNIAYWLNNEFISSDYTGKKLPQQILDYIDYDHVWKTEPSGNGSDGEAECGVALLSQTEFVNNINILGIKDNMNSNGREEDEYNFWWTRSPDCSNSDKVMSIAFLGSILSANPANKRLIRPAFYVDKSFFENVRLDTSYMGSVVKNTLKSLDIGKAGYSPSDLEIIKDNANDFVYVDIDEEWSNGLYDKNYIIDKKISFNIKVDNKSQRMKEASVYWQIGDNKSKVETICINKMSKDSIRVVLPVNTDGRYYIKVFVSLDGEIYTQYDYDINYIESVNIKSINKGYGTGLLNRAESDDALNLLNATGVKTVRAMGYWNNIETKKGEYNWTSVDDHMTKTRASGVDTLYVLGLYNSRLYKTVDEETGQTVTMGSDEEIQAFVNYAKEVVKRYPEITKYEVWNEPNSNVFWPSEPNIDNYKKLIKSVSVALKEINPDIEIIIGVAANSSSNTPTTDGSFWCIKWEDYIASLMQDDELSEYFDAISIHGYYINKTRADQKTYINDVVDIVRQGGGFKKIYMTETGGYSGPELHHKTEDEKAREMVRQFVIGDEYQLDGTWIYELINSGTDPSNSEHNYGVVSSEKLDFRPFEAYYANKYYLSQIDNALYLGKTALNENITAHLYSKDGEAFLVAWSNSENTYDYPFKYEVSQYDLYGNFVTRDTKVSIGDSPVYIYEISDSDANNITKEFIAGHIQAIADDYNYNSYEDIAKSVLVASNAEAVYNVMSQIAEAGSNLINSGELSVDEAKALLYDINRVYNRLSNYLAIIPDAKETCFEDVKKAYEHYKITLENLNINEDKGTKNIYRYCLKELENLSYDSERVYNIPKNDDNYILDKYGKLKVFGEAKPGSVVNFKISNQEGSVVYVGSETADVSRGFSLDYVIEQGFGQYEISIGTSESNECVFVDYENDEQYVSFLQKKYYGKILKIEKLLLLSKDYLFKYSEPETGNNLVVDVAWKVSNLQANAYFTVKNTGDKIDGGIFIAAYDEQGRLVAITKAQQPIDKVDKKEFAFELKFEEKPARIEAFLWNENNIQPLMKVREF